MERTATDAEALDLIRDTLAAGLSAGKTISDIADAVESTGRPIDDE